MKHSAPTRALAHDRRREEIAYAVRLLREGKLVAVPTETVYGLAADARNDAAIARIFAVKGRPSDHPLIVHLADVSWIDAWARDVPAEASKLAQEFWPGPLTLILRRRPEVSLRITAGQDTVALRVPKHPLTLSLLRELESGIAAPSANPFGAVSPTAATDVRAYFDTDSVSFVLDGGVCSVGVESTIVDLSGDRPAVLRPGGVTGEALESVLGRQLATPAQASTRAPGQHPQHYAPRAQVVLCEPGTLAGRVEAELRRKSAVGVLLPDGTTLPPHPRLTAISVPASFEEYARELYRYFREFDRTRVDVVFAMLPEERGIGRAIADRLRRAAGSRTLLRAPYI